MPKYTPIDYFSFSCYFMFILGNEVLPWRSLKCLYKLMTSATKIAEVSAFCTFATTIWGGISYADKPCANLSCRNAAWFHIFQITITKSFGHAVNRLASGALCP